MAPLHRLRINSPGFHNVIAQNIAHDNSNPPGGTDGNGIIFDDGKHTQSDQRLQAGHAHRERPGLLQRRRGIHVFRSTNVAVRNNTAYWNRQLPGKFTWRSDLSYQESDDVTWVNNIGWSNPDMVKGNTALLEQPHGKKQTRRASMPTEVQSISADIGPERLVDLARTAICIDKRHPDQVVTCRHLKRFLERRCRVNSSV